jgi:hypothetical protein
MGGFLSTSAQTAVNPQTEKPKETAVESSEKTVAVENVVTVSTSATAATAATEERPAESVNVNSVTGITESNTPVPDVISNDNPSEVFERHVDPIVSKVTVDPVTVSPAADVTRKNKNKKHKNKNENKNKD